MITFNCANPKCQDVNTQFKKAGKCPSCGKELQTQFNDLNDQFRTCIENGPVQIARPLYQIYNSSLYFKRIHLLSDVLLVAFRLYGHTLIAYYKKHDKNDNEIDQLIESMTSKDTHGGWSSLCSKILQGLSSEEAEMFPGAMFSLFGIQRKDVKQPKIKRPTVKNTVIDWKGKKQEVQVINTPLELLINFRNRYVGHGTVYDEKESKEIFELYEPILMQLIQLFNQVNSAIKFTPKTKVIGFAGTCVNGSKLKVEFDKLKLTVPVTYQLTVSELELNKSKNEENRVHAKTDKKDEEIITTYPYFLAHPYKRTLEEEDPFKRLHLLKETFLNYLKFMGLVVASEYFNSELKIGEVNRNFKNFLYRPQFGHWNAFMRNAMAALDDNKHEWFVKELPAYYKKIETDPYQKHGKTPIGDLIDFRNHYLGHSTVPSDQESEDIYQKYAAILKELLVKMNFAKNYTIVSSGDKTTAWRLMGDNISKINVRIKLLAGEVVLLNASELPFKLAPFYIQPGAFFPGTSAKLMIYEQNTGSRVVFFSPESVHGETTKVLDKLNLMVQDKERLEPHKLKDLNAEKFRALIKENNDDLIDTLINERKIIPGVYQERQDAEIALRSWIGARAGLFFLTAEAGSGKTNLLAEMMRQYTEREIDTIFLRGNRFATANLEEELLRRLNLEKGVSFDKLKFIEYSQENPLMILIDGANEHPESQKLFQNIFDFLEKHKGGRIKVVLSWRVNTKSELPLADEKYEPIVYAEKTDGISEDTLIQRSCYWLKPLNKKEVESAWELYTVNKAGKDKIGRKPNFSYEQLTYHDRSLSDQLDNPLLMRFFLEMFHGKGLPKSRGGFISIWTLYHQKLISQ